jgi:hypothetical protein
MFGEIAAIAAASAAVGTSAMIEEQTKNMSPEEKRVYLDRLAAAKMPEIKPEQTSCSLWGFVLGLIVGSSGD